MIRLYTILSFVALSVAAACSHNNQKKKMAMPAMTVEVSTAKPELISDRISCSSQIQSLHEAIIQPRVDGYLNSQEYKDGARVKRGKVLFTITPGSIESQLLSAKAELESAMAQEVLARNNYNRAVPLAEIDAISQSDLDEYTATHSAAKASVKSARESLRSAELDMTYTTITSPIDGIVAKSKAVVGDYIGPSTELSTLTTVAYIDSVMVEIPISSSIYLRHVSENGGSSDSLLSDIELALSSGELYPHKGEYYYTMPSSPTNTSTVVIVAKFPNPEHRLRSGMYAKISSKIGSASEQVVVPQKAVSQSQGINRVWVISSDSIAKQRTVELGDTIDDMWIIKSGISSGEKVVTSGSQKVHNGVKVSPTVKN